MIDNPDRALAEEAFGCIVKRCSKCMEWLPSDTEFFPRHSPSPIGLHSWCKACWSERSTKRSKAGADHLTA
jgi:hypothetical protein